MIIMKDNKSANKDFDSMEKAFGGGVEGLKGKTTRSRADAVRDARIEIPTDIFSEN